MGNQCCSGEKSKHEMSFAEQGTEDEHDEEHYLETDNYKLRPQGVQMSQDGAAQGLDEQQEEDFFVEGGFAGQRGRQPFIGQIEEPTNHNEPDKRKPAEQFELEHVYGYRSGPDTRSNLYYNAKGEAVYFTACLGVIHNLQDNTQKFFGGYEVEDVRRCLTEDNKETGHDDDIHCLSMSQDRKMAATGQIGARPYICLWDSETAELIQKISLPKGSLGIKCVAISEDKEYVACVDMSVKIQVHMFKIATKAKMFVTNSTISTVTDMNFSLEKGSLDFACCGKGKIVWFNEKGKQFQGKNEGCKTTSHLSMCWDNQGHCYTGGVSGEINVWKDKNWIRKFNGHANFTGSLQFADDNEGMILSGGRSGDKYYVNVYEAGSGKLIHDFEMDSMVRGVDYCIDNLIVGTGAGDLMAINIPSQARTPFMSSHSTGELWGLAEVNENTIVTSSDDNKVITYDINTRTMVESFQITKDERKAPKGGASSQAKNFPSQQSRAVRAHNGDVIVAMNDGKIRVLNNASKTEKTLIPSPQEWTQCLQVSPCGQYLAAGSHDDTIYVYDIQQNYKLAGKLNEHSTYLTSVDWSADSKYIRSTCGAQELLYFHVPEFKQDKSGKSNTVDTVWATNTAKFGWHVQGIHHSDEDYTHINAVCGDQDGDLIVTGDDYCLMRVMRNPCLFGHASRAYRAHAEHVTNVMMIGDRIFSAGGQDQTICQWKKC